MARKTPLRILLTLGTRPEIVKLAPVARALRERGAAVTICLTGQHIELARPFLRLFPFKPKYELKVMRQGQELADLTARLFAGLEDIIAFERPDAVVVQGDTTSAFVAAVTAFYHHVPLAHVEAGLRSGSLDEPFPEELNRRLVSVVATYHYAPTPGAAAQLRAMDVPAARIVVTGNTGIDTVLRLSRELNHRRKKSQRLVIVTAHRRENVGAPLERICNAVQRIARKHQDVRVLWPLHANPAVRRQVISGLGGIPRVKLVEALPYERFVPLLAESTLVLTDSGGIQEEVTSLGKPVLILRDVTERPEVITAGNGILVGSDEDRIFREASRLLTDPLVYRRHARKSRIFGDGKAGERVARHLLAALSRRSV